MAELEQKFQEIIQKFRVDLGSIRTGRATSSLVEDLPVKAYDSMMKIRELVSISIPEPRQILISPWDQSTLKAVDDALRVHGFSPAAEGNALRLILPPLTGEDRERLTREVSQHSEEAKVALRQARREEVEEVEENEKNKEISKDESFAQKREIDALQEEYIRKVEEISQEKKDQLTIE